MTRSLLATCLAAAIAGTSSPSAQAPAFFPDRDMMTVGVYYYPEAWPRAQWARDLANIKRHGFELVHMGEFAWAFMEPEDGRFDFAWLDEAVKLAAAEGLKVVLCTPTATPPAWLTRAHPETLMVDHRGRRMDHGGRAHATWSSPVYRQYGERIIDQLGQRYGRNANVWGWQIDNELSHYGRYSYAEPNQRKFREWLRARYRTIDALNAAWGNAFWSQMYNDFGQIEIPNADELIAGVNEHALLDFQRWFADEAADYIRFQAGVRSFAAGAKVMCTYRYRQPRFGNEQYHSGIVGTDGVTLSRGGEEWVQAMKEIRELREARPASPAPPARYTARRTAFLYNVDNRNDLDNHPQTNRWDTVGHLFKYYYRALKGLGAPVDVITEDRNFSDYPFMVAPAYQLADAALVKRWTEYVEKGGHLILSARTATKNRNAHLWEGAWAEPIRSLIGAGISYYDVLPEPRAGHVRPETAAAAHEWTVWAEVIAPSRGTRVLATYTDHFYAGRAAAISRKLGSGTVTYIGVETTSGQLEKEIVRRVFSEAGVRIEDYPDQFLVDWRDGFWIASNFSSSDRIVPAPPGVTLIVGTRRLPPAGVAIWKE